MLSLRRGAMTGLVATQSIRAGASGRVLKRIADELTIFCAWADEPWVVDGAAVRGSLVCFADPELAPAPTLDGQAVAGITATLPAFSSSRDINATRVLA